MQPRAANSQSTTSILPAHREWPDLFSLDLPAITDYLNNVNQRCITTRVTLDTSLTRFDALMKSFIAPQSIESYEDVDNYRGNFKLVFDASRNIFPPQEEYRAALTTLGLFVTDLINLLPKNSELWESLRLEFDDGMQRANFAEENIRKSIRELGDNSRKLEKRYALGLYLYLMQERVKSWSEEEERFKEWAKECVMAML